jgi:hypothetical protein
LRSCAEVLAGDIKGATADHKKAHELNPTLYPDPQDDNSQRKK